MPRIGLISSYRPHHISHASYRPHQSCLVSASNQSCLVSASSARIGLISHASYWPHQLVSASSVMPRPWIREKSIMYVVFCFNRIVRVYCVEKVSYGCAFHFHRCYCAWLRNSFSRSHLRAPITEFGTC